jgi:hypothetical protein
MPGKRYYENLYFLMAINAYSRPLDNDKPDSWLILGGSRPARLPGTWYNSRYRSDECRI